MDNKLMDLLNNINQRVASGKSQIVFSKTPGAKTFKQLLKKGKVEAQRVTLSKIYAEQKKNTRDCSIQADDLMNIKIMLGSSQDVNDFISQLKGDNNA